MTKFTADEKIQIVLRYLKGNESCREIGISNTIILNWVNQYKQNGVEAFLKRCTNYTQQFKLDVLNFMIENGMSLFETAAIFNIPALQRFLFGKNSSKYKELMPFNLRKGASIHEKRFK